MRNWGIIITTFYCAVLVFLLFPAAIWFDGYVHALLTGRESYLSYGEVFRYLLTYQDGGSDVFSYWLWIAILVGGQALLLFVSVDTAWRRNKPRQHVLVTSLLAGLLTALLAFFFAFSVAMIVYGDDMGEAILFNPFDFQGERLIREPARLIGWWLALWCFWGAIFYWHYRRAEGLISLAVSWLLAGSVLELLIAVPAHVFVRHRDDCSAPFVTSWGIVTGIAIMLLCFGPGVLALYKRRINDYRRPAADYEGEGSGPG